MSPTLIPPERPAPTTNQLAFILHGDYWWPAITYSSYGQAMEERHATLSLKTKNMLAFKMIDEHHANLSKYGKSDEIHQNKICQVLGYEDEWIEFDDQRSIYVFLPHAVAQNIPHSLQPAFSLALRQVQELLGSYVTNATSESTSTSQPSTSNEARSNNEHPGALVTPRIWGRDKISAVKVNDLDNTKPKINRNKAQDILGKKRGPSDIAKSSNVSESKRRRLSKLGGKRSTNSKNRRKSGDISSQSISQIKSNFYSYLILWPYLQQEGWKLVKSRNKLENWNWIRPGKDAITGKRNVDFFTTSEDMINWAKRVKYFDKVKDQVLSNHSSGAKTMPEESDESVDNDTIETADASRKSISSMSHLSTISHSKKTFSQVWKPLREQGWTMVDARKHNLKDDAVWYWVRPGVIDIKKAKRGLDYFASTEELMQWAEANEEDNFDGSVSTPPNCRKTIPQDPGKPLLRESSDSEESEDDTTKWRNLWSRLQKYGWQWKKGGGLHDYYYVRPNKSVKTGKLGVDFFTTEKDVIEFENRRDNLENRIQLSDEDVSLLREESASRIPLTPAVTQKNSIEDMEWWRTTSVPDVWKVWNTLSQKLAFRFMNGFYRLPVGCNHPAAQDPKMSEVELRCLLCQYGIPNLDDELITPEERTTLIRWATFANVPVNPKDSVFKLQDIDPSLPKGALTTLGIKKKMSKGYQWGDLKFDSLEDLRVYIRGLPSLFPETTHRRGVKLTLDPGTNLGLRLWAALSPRPLIKFVEK